jgi:hypothetical protein
MALRFKSQSAKAVASAAAENPLPYEVGEFSIKHGLSIFEARRILRDSQSRQEADAAAGAEKLRRLSSTEREPSDGTI